jgi:hypothetical protein
MLILTCHTEDGSSRFLRNVCGDPQIRSEPPVLDIPLPVPVQFPPKRHVSTKLLDLTFKKTGILICPGREKLKVTSTDRPVM